jgi:hypothetical protein
MLRKVRGAPASARVRRSADLQVTGTAGARRAQLWRRRWCCGEGL